MSEQQSCGFFKGILKALPNKVIVPLFLFSGVAAGLGIYNIYASRLLSYFGNDPSSCVNCHIMSAAYKSWERDAHSKWTTCKDCHTPQDSKLAELMFDAKDGINHATVLLMNKQPSAPRPLPAAVEVIQKNCVRCHTRLTTEFASVGKATFDDIQHGNQKACWDCHRHVPHTKNSGLASAPNTIVPLQPAAPVPDWLKNILQ